MDFDTVTLLDSSANEALVFRIPVRLPYDSGNIPARSQEFAEFGKQLPGGFAIRPVATIQKYERQVIGILRVERLSSADYFFHCVFVAVFL